jgi:hypothetical protein
MAGKKTRKKTAAEKPKGYSVLLDPRHVKALQSLSKEQGRTITFVVNQAVENHLILLNAAEEDFKRRRAVQSPSK